MEEGRDFHSRNPVFLGYLDFAEEQFKNRGGRQCDLAKLDAAGVEFAVVSIGFGCYFQLGPKEFIRAGDDDWLLRRQLERIDLVLDTIDAALGPATPTPAPPRKGEGKAEAPSAAALRTAPSPAAWGG